MDNEKKPGYLEKLLQRGKQKAVNENPALDEKKVLAPIKDESTTLPTERDVSSKIQTDRDKDNKGRSIGGESSTPKQAEGEHKTPRQKILEKGEQKPFRGKSGGGAGLEGMDLLKKKDDFIKTDDNLSEKGTGKQQKQEHQEQQAQYKQRGKENPGIQEVKPQQEEKSNVKRSLLKDIAVSLLPSKEQTPEKTGVQLPPAKQENKETDTPKKPSKLQQIAMNLASSTPQKEAPAKIKTPTK